MNLARARRATVAAVIVAVVPLSGLAACGSSDPGDSSGGTEQAAPPHPAGTPSAPRASLTHGSAPDRTRLPHARDLVADFSGLLDARATALLDGDRTAFDAGLDPDDAGLRIRQDGYFDNLAQLPLQALAYRVDPTSLVREGDRYWVTVEVGLQLAGFDALPVVRPDRYAFTAASRSRGSFDGFRLSSVTDPAWEAAHHLVGQPWDVEPVQVRVRDGVLGVFDATSVASAPALMRSFVRGAADVASRVPYGWSGSVVFYALGGGSGGGPGGGSGSDPFAAELAAAGVPTGGEPAHLDGLAFGLPSSATDPRTAATRVIVGPEVLAAPATERDRLVRHELTHVAVGDHDDDAPGWLREGLAEWVSVQGLPARDLGVPASIARTGRHATSLPTDADLAGPQAPAAYALARFAVEWMAKRAGPDAPWTLLDRLDRLDTNRSRSLGQATRRLLGVGPDGVARHAAGLLRKAAR